LTFWLFCDTITTSVVLGVRTRGDGGSLTSQIITVHVYMTRICCLIIDI